MEDRENMEGDRISKVKALKDQYAASLFNLDRENVTCVYVGHKKTKGVDTGVLAVVVGVRVKFPLKELRVEKIIPTHVGIPGESIAPTDVVETGEIFVLSLHPVKPKQTSRTGKVRPAPPGVSVGHYKITAGTFGFVAIEEATGREVPVSNEHVFTALTVDDSTKVGDLILQQGKYDGGTSPENDWARLQKWGGVKPNIDNYYDAAYATPINPKDMVKAFFELKKYPTKWRELQDVGDVVIKDGRSCGVADARVVGIEAQVVVNYGRFIATFYRQILTEKLLIAGDSGSAVLDSKDYTIIIGLGFAGSDTISVINPIKLILEGRAPHERLGLRLPEAMPKKYLPSESDEVQVKIKKVGMAESRLTLSTDKGECYEGDKFTASGKLTDAITGEGIPSREIHLLWNSSEWIGSTDVSGSYSVVLDAPIVPPGEPDLTLRLKSRFNGDA